MRLQNYINSTRSISKFLVQADVAVSTAEVFFFGAAKIGLGAIEQCPGFISPTVGGT